MELFKFQMLAFAAMMLCTSIAYGWGVDGHFITCRLAQPRLSKSAADAVSQLLPTYANNDLASLCSWPDQIRPVYPWSSSLHFLNTPDNLCTYEYNRDCKDADGVPDRCVAGAINNYTSQLLGYGCAHFESQHNLTEALLLLSHLVGDIHQPLHVGFVSDKGGNTIDVNWYTNKTNLHHVWDGNIIETAKERFYDSKVGELINNLQTNITTVWAKEAMAWESCSQTACPDIYASEGVEAACGWAYKGVHEGSVLEDDYFLSRYPVVNTRLAQGGIRLAAILNRIFE